MDKNTIWAVVLSTLVLIGSYLILPKIFPNMFPQITYPEQVAEENQDTESTEENAELASVGEYIAADISEEIETETESVEESQITITTDLAEIVLTNKGGDIISYKLLNHQDTDTGTGVQISDNVSDLNRTCALAIGAVDSKIIQDVFNVDQKTEANGDKTVLFTKTINVDGKKYVLGKKYTFKNGEFVFKLDVLIHGNNGLNRDGIAYTIRTSPQIGPHYDPKANRYDNRQFVAYNGSKSKRIMLSNGMFKRYDKDFIWCGAAGKYFVELLIPSQPETLNAAYYSSKIEANNYSNAQALVERKAYSGSDVQDTYYMYFGPRNEKDLKRYNIAENNAWGIGGKKVTESLQTSQMLSWVEFILKIILELLHKIIPNWGVAIIIMTILLKVLMYPMSKKQSLSTLKMQELQPRIQSIQEKYKNDQQKLQAETAKIYQEAGYNPASGCLPLLFQFLIIIAMYNLFNNYFEFRGAMFIPGWIPDLSVGDSVHALKFTIPLLATNQIRILPVIYVATQLISGKISQTGQPAGQSAASMKFMMYGMPLIFFFLFYNAPSGLLLYWLTSNILQTGQQLLINKLMAGKKAEMNSKKGNQTKKIAPKGKK